MLKALLAIGAAAALAGPIAAQPAGAAAGAPMQPGGWGQGGWQAGDGYAATPATTRDPSGMAAPARPAPSARWHGDYRRAERGGRLSGPWLEPGYAVRDWRDWGLAPPPAGTRWVRYYDDAVLIDAGGSVLDTRYGLDWDAPRGGALAGPVGPRPAFGRTVVRTGPNTVVTTETVEGPTPVVAEGGDAYDDGYGYGGQTVTVTPGTITTTTTTTEVTAWRPSRHRRGHRRCACRR